MSPACPRLEPSYWSRCPLSRVGLVTGSTRIGGTGPVMYLDCPGRMVLDAASEPECEFAVSRMLVRLAIATTGGCIILAWALLDLDISWLALGGGLVTGNLLAWVAASVRVRSTERQLTWLLWALFAGLALSFVVLRNGFLTFYCFGGLLAIQIHYFFDRYRQVIRPRCDGQ